MNQKKPSPGSIEMIDDLNPVPRSNTKSLSSEIVDLRAENAKLREEIRALRGCLIASNNLTAAALSLVKGN